MIGRALPGLAFAGLAVALVAEAAHAVSTIAGFSATVQVTGLAQPTGAAFLPDGRLVITEKGGTLRVWTAAGGLREAPLLTLPVCTASEMGLLGVAVDPAFAVNGFLYLYVTQPPGGDPSRCDEGTEAGRVSRVVRVTVAGDTIDPASLVVLLDGIRTDRGNHDGGALAIGPDGFLYVGTGDTGLGDSGPPGASTNPYAQDVQRIEGKILRIGLDGSTPPDNPFADRGGNAARVWAYGFRNPFRIAFDPIEPGPRRLWIGDVGQNTWEEIDVGVAGGDFGWPRCEGPEPTNVCPGDSVAPVHVYRHPSGADEGVSVTGGIHYDGTQFDDTQRGAYFFGDYGLDVVWRADVNASRDGFDGDPRQFATDAGSPVQFLVGPDGALHWVAIALGAVVRVTQDGRPGASVGGCERAVAQTAATALRRATRKATACLARGRSSCLPPGIRPARRERRTIDRRCDEAGRARVCARIGCTPCGTTADLAACSARLAASTAGTVLAPVASAGAGRCLRAAASAGGTLAGGRLEAIVACAGDGNASCVPPPSAPDTAPRALQRRCTPPPAALCASLACDACATAADLARCLAAHAAEPVDALASVVLGVAR